MSSTKISALVDGSAPVATDTFAVARSGGVNRKLSITQLFASPEPIGATTPSSGAFTSLSATAITGSTFNGSALGTAAFVATTAFDAAGTASSAVSAHASLQTGVHGISITSSKTFSCTNTLTLSGTDGSTLNVGTGGTLGTAAYTAATAYETSGATSTHAALQTGVHGISITSGKTLYSSNTLTLAGTDGSTLNIGTGGTLGTAAYTASTAYDVAGAAAAVTPTSLGLVIGTNTQAYNLKLTTIAALANGTGWLYNDGSGVFSYSVPTTVSGNAGTATTLATARAIYGNNFDGSAALTQVIASTYGGTGNGYTKFSGPTSTEKTFSLPDASDTVACLGQAQTFTKAQRGSFVALTDAATVDVDLSLSNQFSLVLGGNRTLGVPTNIVKGQQGVISIRQDSTGSRTLAYAWPYEWAGGTAGTLTTAGCSRDQLVYSVEEYATSTVTITNATPGVVSWTAHGLENGQRVQLTTTGALPTGLTASTTYFVAGKGTNDFKLSTTLANAAAGTYIATSSAGSGTHTCVACSISVALNKAYA